MCNTIGVLNGWKRRVDDADPINMGIEIEYVDRTNLGSGPFKSVDDNIEWRKKNTEKDSEIPYSIIPLTGYHINWEGLSEYTEGWELKTPILSLENWNKESKQILKKLKPFPTNRWSGIHVNVEVNNKTNNMFQSALEFLTNNQPKFTVLSRRKTLEYTTFSPQYGTNNHSFVLSTRKNHAFEFRLFNTSRINSLIAAETAHLLFSKKMNDWADFVANANNDRRYGNLAKQLQKLNLTA